MASPHPNYKITIPLHRPTTKEEYKEYQHWIASLDLPKKEKSPSENERYIKLLNRTISFPEKMLMNLPKAAEGKRQIHGTFYKRTNCLKQGFYYYGGNVQTDVFPDSGFYANRGIRVAPPTPVTPISPNREKTSPNRRIHDKSYLSETILKAELAIAHFETVSMYLNIFACRYQEAGIDLCFEDQKSGLPQLAGFCERISMVTEPAMIGTDILSVTSYFGLKIASEFIQDPNSLLTILHEENMPILYTGPTYDQNLSAKIKIQVGRDAIISAYERLGRQGFRGGWASLKNHNPDIINYEEIELVVLELLKGMFGLVKWCEAAVELYRTLVHTDTIEKSYLLAHMSSMRIQDQIDVVLRVDESRLVTERLYQALSEVNQRSHNIALHLQLRKLECQKNREIRESISLKSFKIPTDTTTVSDYETVTEGKKEILPIQTLKFIEDFVTDKMELMAYKYDYEPPSFPLDPPFRSS